MAAPLLTAARCGARPFGTAGETGAGEPRFRSGGQREPLGAGGGTEELADAWFPKRGWGGTGPARASALRPPRAPSVSFPVLCMKRELFSLQVVL